MGGVVVDESVMEDNEKFVRQLEEGELKENHDAVVEHMKELVAEAGISTEVRIRTNVPLHCCLCLIRGFYEELGDQL